MRRGHYSKLTSFRHYFLPLPVGRFGQYLGKLVADRSVGQIRSIKKGPVVGSSWTVGTVHYGELDRGNGPLHFKGIGIWRR